MALRVDPADVLEIMPDTDLDEAGVNPYLNDASLWVDNYLVGTCQGLSASKLGVIEKYLAAHLATIAGDGTELLAATRADISERYAVLNRGETTRYIGTAAAYDPCGIVAEHWMSGRRMKFRVGAGYRGRT